MALSFYLLNAYKITSYIQKCCIYVCVLSGYGLMDTYHLRTSKGVLKIKVTVGVRFGVITDPALGNPVLPIISSLSTP